MFWEQSLQYASMCDIGFRRQNNQDACVVFLASSREQWMSRGHLFVVADGMGGHAVGELASKMATDIVPHTFDKLTQLDRVEALRTAIETANNTIHERGLKNPEFLRMGTTCTALLLSPAGMYAGHVGDSRAYRIRKQKIEQITCDHSLVWELIRQKKVRAEDAERLFPRNVITRSLGPEPKVQVDIEGPHPVLPGDTFVLCSDGLSGPVSDTEIGMIAGALSPGESSRLLVNLANLRGGADNITVVVVRAGLVPKNAQHPEDFEPESPAEAEMEWETFIKTCGIAAGAVIGLLLTAATEQKAAGWFLLGAMGLLLLGWGFQNLWKKWHEPPREAAVEKQPQVANPPYRTAPAKVTSEFVNKLARMEQELQQAAREEAWPISWKEQEQHSKKAAELASKAATLSLALQEYAQSLDLLMEGVHHQRRLRAQQQRQATAAPPADSKPQV